MNLGTETKDFAKNPFIQYSMIVVLYSCELNGNAMAQGTAFVFWQIVEVIH